MVRDFKSRGVPIDCVGLQTHFTGGSSLPGSFQTTLSSFAALGVDVALTEVVRHQRIHHAVRRPHPGLHERLPMRGYHRVGRNGTATLAFRREPLLFNGSGQPKAAYTSVLNVLNSVNPNPSRAGPPRRPVDVARTVDIAAVGRREEDRRYGSRAGASTCRTRRRPTGRACSSTTATA